MSRPENSPASLPDRRTIVAGGIGLAAFACAGGARAAAARKVGILTRQAPGSLDPNLRALEAGLIELGHRPGQSIIFEARYADGDAARLPALTAELLAQKVDLIIAQADAAVFLKDHPPPVPVIFVFSGDPVAAGLADSLAKPAAMMTGLTFMAAETSAKRIELLAEIVPGLEHCALIANPEHPGQFVEKAYAEDAAKRLGISLLAFATPGEADLRRAFEAIAAARPGGLIVFSDTFAFVNRAAIAEFGLAQRIPVIGGWEAFARSGFLLSYGPNRLETYRRMAAFIDRIFKGARAEDLPIEQPTRFELTVNLKTARAIGVTLPPSILLRADEVIE